MTAASPEPRKKTESSDVRDMKRVILQCTPEQRERLRAARATVLLKILKPLREGEDEGKAPPPPPPAPSRTVPT